MLKPGGYVFTMASKKNKYLNFILIKKTKDGLYKVDLSPDKNYKKDTSKVSIIII